MARPRKTMKALGASGATKVNPGRFEDRQNEPQPKGSIGAPPEYFTGEQKSIWHEIVMIVADGVLTNMDRIALEGACRVLYEIRSSAKFSSAMHQALISYLSRFGMTPADRSRVNTGSKPKDNKFKPKEWN